jgi:hypothetical protein
LPEFWRIRLHQADKIGTWPQKKRKSGLSAGIAAGHVPIRVIRQFARDVAKRFHPERIILFGSHASGTPHEDSDVVW